MREWTVGVADAGRRLDRVLTRDIPSVSMGGVQKLLRQGRIRRNGRTSAASDRLEAGDILTVDLDEAAFEAPKRHDRLLERFHPNLYILYEDAHILLVDKPVGLLCHPDEREKVQTLLTHVHAYLYQKGVYDPDSGFVPALCNRIDRFTSGIVIAAKDRAGLIEMDRAIRAGHVHKFYLAAIVGRMRPAEGRLIGYVRKGTRRVEVLAHEAPDAQYAETAYRTLAESGNQSLVECELLTGRTHQIRAQFAHAGHPLVGDGQYGAADAGGRDCQTLCAYRVEFDFPANGALADIAGGSCTVRRLPAWVDRFGPVFS